MLQRPVEDVYPMPFPLPKSLMVQYHLEKVYTEKFIKGIQAASPN